MRYIFPFKTNAQIASREWHTWFAWHPILVKTDSETTLVWLENVARRWVATSVENGNFIYELLEKQ